MSTPREGNGALARSILIADASQPSRDQLTKLLEQAEYEVTCAETGEKALQCYQAGRIDRRKARPGDPTQRTAEQGNPAGRIDLVFLEQTMPDGDGLQFLREIRASDPRALVIMLTERATVEDAVESLKLGAFDYIQKNSSRMKEVLPILDKAFEQKELVEENRRLREELTGKFQFDRIVAKSKAMREIFERIRQVAPARTTVLIEGESGTGKELVARAIHFNSPRKAKQFVPLNCGGIPETLLESELFGYARGSFTGAVGSKKGLFEAADGGTLFLDEVTSMPSSLQVKLLRALQEGAFYPVGSTQEVKVDVRVIAASNQDLSQAVAQGAFREDLYYRLNVIPIQIPPLRARREDILLLATHFLEKFKASLPKTLEGFSKEASELLLRYDWPGNVRELENAVEHGVTLAQGPFIEVTDLPEIKVAVPPQASSWVALFVAHPLRLARQMFEREYFRELLKISHGNVSEAARMAQIARQNLQVKLKSLDLDPREVPRHPKTPSPAG